MIESAELNREEIETIPLEVFTEKAYLEYSMYVILDRALPHVEDGLKPVQRRIVYAMSELGLKSTAKYKKSARTVGDVLGKFHPHGDTACYEAMVLMAQPFAYRYPLIDGQGNWGAQDDPKSFAAMRYTESRLSAYADILLSELGQGTVDWGPNFDGSLEEPCVLPARLPNILLNGTSGIAVGMATDIPPHNLRETADACIHLLENPKAEIEELLQHLRGPDYPTNAEIITPYEELVKMYSTGTGSIRMRAIYYYENGDIVVSALPYQVSGAKVLEQIATQMRKKKLPMVADLRDESDHEEPIRLIIVPRSNRVDKEELMAHLFATTDLERTYRVNMNIIGLNGRPQVRGLVQLLQEWLNYRTETVRRRLQFRLEKALKRLHILDGLLIVYLNLDKVIAIIRNEDHPKQVLIKRFQISEVQAEAILETRLRHLAKLEEMKIKREQQELTEERDMLEKILGSPARLKTLIKKELNADRDKFGDDRRSPIVERQEAKALTAADIMPVEPVTVILSNNGWVRAAKGHEIDAEALNYKSGDHFKALAFGKSTEPAIFLDSTGRSYSLPAHSFPSARGQGEPLTGRLSPPPDGVFETVLMGKPEQPLLMASDSGYGFITKLSELYTKNRNGKLVITLPRASKPLPPVMVQNPAKSLLIAISNEGRLLIFPLKKLPTLSKGKGNKIIHIPPARAAERKEIMTFVDVLSAESTLVIYAGKRHLSLKPGNLADFMGERGRRGRKLPRGFRKVDRLETIDPEQMTLI